MAFAAPRASSQSARVPKSSGRRPQVMRTASMEAAPSAMVINKEEEPDLMEAYSHYLQSEMILWNARRNAAAQKRDAEETVSKLCALISAKMEEVSRLQSANAQAEHLKKYVVEQSEENAQIEEYLKVLEPAVERLTKIADEAEKRNCTLVVKGDIEGVGDHYELQSLIDDLNCTLDSDSKSVEEANEAVKVLNEFKAAKESCDKEWCQLQSVTKEVEKLTLKQACQRVAFKAESDEDGDNDFFKI